MCFAYRLYVLPLREDKLNKVLPDNAQVKNKALLFSIVLSSFLPAQKRSKKGRHE